MADVFGKQVDLSGLLKEIQDAASQLKIASEDAGEAIGIGFNEGYDDSIQAINASSIKLSRAFKNLRDKITKQVQQFSTTMNGKKMQLKIDFSDIDLNSADIKKRISNIFEEFTTRGLIEFDTKGSEKQFQNLIELYVKYSEKLRSLQDGMSSISDVASMQKNLQEQYALAKQLNEIYDFLENKTNVTIPLNSYSKTIRKTEELLSVMSNLKDVTKNVSGSNVDGLADSLQQILQVLQEIRAAFEPINKALTTEGTAFNKMSTDGSASLDTLLNKLQELSNMVDALNKKEFNVTNLITQKGNVSESVSILKGQAKTLLDVVQQLVEAQNEIYKTNNAVYQTAMRQSDGIVGSSLWDLSGFDAVDLTKKITKSGSETKLLEHISTLEYYKDTVLRIINEINKVAPNTIDTSAILSKLNAVQQAAKDSTSTEKQDNQTQDSIGGVIDKIKAERSQVEEEFKSIRQIIESTFDFSTLDPNTTNVQSITDKIYQQFVELQNKIKALDFKIETPTVVGIAEATEAIKQEGQAAESATPKKNDFTAANQKVAESMKETGDAGKVAAAGVKAEAEAVEETVKTLNNIDNVSISAEKIAEKYNRSGRKWDENRTSTLESKSKHIADSFNDYISTAGFNVSDINTSFLDKKYKTEDGTTGLYEVVKLVAKGTDALGEVVTITQEYNMASGALEQEATKFQDAVNKFDLTTAKNTAESQVQELKSQMGSFKIDTADLEAAKGSIVDEESFEVFNEQLKNAKQRLAEIKAMLKSSKSLDPLVNSENMMTNLDATVKTYQESIKKFVDVEGYDKLEQSLANITEKQREFNEAKQDGDGTRMAAAVSEINKEMASYEANLRLVNARYQERNRLAIESAKDDKLSADIEKQSSALEKQRAQWQKNGQLTEEVRSQVEAMAYFLTEVTDDDGLAEWKKQWAILKNEVMATKHEASDAIAELKKSSGVDTSIRSVGEDNIGAGMKQKIAEYKQLITELQDMMSKLSNNRELANDTTFANNLADTALKAKNARIEIEGIFNESQKLQKIGTLIQTGDKDVSQIQNLKSEMIAFASSALDGEVRISGFNKEGNEMYATLTKSNGAVENITVALNKSTGQLQAFTTGTSKATNEWNRLKTEAADGVKRLATMYLSFHDIIRYGRQGLDYVKEIDLAMTELKKVTDETDASYKEFLKDAGSTSAVIGSTISDFTNASATFARLGYSLEESSSMAETAIIYKNVADGLDSVEESSQSIISTMMAFGIEANDTMSIIDRFNAVGKYIAQAI